MNTYASPRTESNLPAISNCWKRKDCDGGAADLPLERVAPKAERKSEPSSRPLFGNNPFESFENAFQSISF
jgi:hypothetical protein